MLHESDQQMECEGRCIRWQKVLCKGQEVGKCLRHVQTFKIARKNRQLEILIEKDAREHDEQMVSTPQVSIVTKEDSLGLLSGRQWLRQALY